MRLEWIEIYNQENLETDLGEYILIADSDTNYFPDGTFIPPYSYAILARQLVPDNGSDSFESYWGDSSGIWGDSDLEAYAALDVDITLSNNSGDISILSSAHVIVDGISWDISSDDGRSIERDDVADYNSGWHDSYDPSGSTPGRENSGIPPGGEEIFRVDIDPVVLSIEGNDFEEFSIEVVIPPATKLTVNIFDETGYKIKTLMEDSETDVQELGWDGRDDKGRILSPGIYIICLSISGARSQSKNYPVVIAP